LISRADTRTETRIYIFFEEPDSGFHLCVEIEPEPRFWREKILKKDYNWGLIREVTINFNLGY
jgi:hypothetical protein